MKATIPHDQQQPGANTEHDRALSRIAAAMRGLEFGTVTAVIQNGVVVQVERTEKGRLAKSD